MAKGHSDLSQRYGGKLCHVFFHRLGKLDQFLLILNVLWGMLKLSGYLRGYKIVVLDLDQFQQTVFVFGSNICLVPLHEAQQ
eukprot:scaffold748_cov329-Pavlova_lutheri.AAC.23